MGGRRPASSSPLRKRSRGSSDAEEPKSQVVSDANTASKRLKIQKAPKGGRRGAALLAASGVHVTNKSSSPLAPSPLSASASPPPATPRSPRSKPLAKQLLPKKLASLSDLFLAVQTVYGIMRSRGLRTTYQGMRQAVEEASGRRFLASHLAQLQTLLPGAVQLEWVRLPVAPRSTRTIPHLLLTLPPAAGEEVSALRCEVHCQLATHLIRSYAAHAQQQAEELRSAGDEAGAAGWERELEAVKSPPLHRFMRPYPDAVPDVPEAQLPLKPGEGSSPPAVRASAQLSPSGSPAGQAQDAAPEVAGPRGPAPADTPAVSSRLHQRRLSFAAATEGGDAGAGAPSLPAGDAALLASMPEELRRRSQEGVISLDTLRTLQANERAHRRLSSRTAVAARGASAAVGELPRTFARLRRIFGTQGPSALTLEEVVRRVRQGGCEMTSDADVVEQVRALAEHAPEFVELRPWGACGTPAVWIRRRCDGNAVAARLKGLAEGRRAAVRAAVAGVAAAP